MVPGGSSIRDGCYVAQRRHMHASYVHQRGRVCGRRRHGRFSRADGKLRADRKKCHISAASQIGGVLEPVGALPVIIEDEVLVGGNCGVYEGTVVKKRAILGSGTILNRSTPVYDIVTGEVHTASDDEPLMIPENAVVVAGSRAISHGPARSGICRSTHR